MTPFYRINRFAIKKAFQLYFRIGVDGQEKIPREGPVILAANHTSFIDPVAVGVMCPRQIHPLAREDLWSIPLLRWWLSRMGAKPIKRGQGDTGALRAALEVLGHGKTVLVFPEGTRSRDGTIGPMKPGVGLLASRSRAPIVPTYISGTFLALPRTRSFPLPVKIGVHFAAPIGQDLIGEYPADRRGYEEITRRVDQAIRAIQERENRKARDHPEHGVVEHEDLD
ncbi:MAG: lysophospholipid acyltransferase family protein [bacterium]